MNATSTKGLIISGLGQFSNQGLIILGAVIVIAVGLIIFYWGMRKIQNIDKIDFLGGGAMGKEYRKGKKMGLWENYDSYLND